MSVIHERMLPLPEEIKEQFPVPENVLKIKAERDAEIAKIFTGEDDRIILIIGPCSADREEPVIEYIHRLARLKEKVAD